MKNLIKRLAKLLFGNYNIYHIYSPNTEIKITPPLSNLQFSIVEKYEIENSNDQIIRDQAWYHGQGVHAYACREGARIVGLCFFWYGERYLSRNFWPLANHEAKLVQLITLPDMRNQGIAGALINYGTQEISIRGFTRVYARIWFSNRPSLRTFKRTGWTRVATVIELNLFNRKSSFKVTI